VSHPFRDVASGMPQTLLLDKSLWLPFIEGTRLDTGFIFILIVYGFVLIYSHRSVPGYHAKMTGLSIEFAATSGINIFSTTLKTLAFSGAIAGLVGAIAVLGIHHRFTDGMLVQPLYAWTGIVAALLINLVPWAILPAGFFFASLTSGASGMERTADVPKEIAIIIQGIIILFVASRATGIASDTKNKEEGN
jgi:simple sugar transport system permease protein